MEKDNNQSDNKGCLIFVVIAVVISLIYIFSTTSAKDFAEMGSSIMLIVGLVISYFVIKKLNLFNFTSAEDKRRGQFQGSDVYRLENEDYNCGYNQENRHETASDSTDKKGCMKALLAVISALVIIGLIVTATTSSFDVNAGVGMFFVIAFVIGIAVYAYFNMKGE